MPTAKFVYVFLFPSTMSVHGHGGDSLRRQLLQQLGPSSSGIPTPLSLFTSFTLALAVLVFLILVYGSYWYTCIVGGVVGAVYTVDVGGMTAEYALHWKALTDEKCPSALLKTYDTYSKELKCIQEILK
ncbi:hypothetical protein B0H14DRAFT_3879943 [Mycena olivaceomarginata]|nr:hypothetical protein B0H14DRAFT_3879943 [Mycena olivaceomarginata]